eukprot:CAMPEP_0196659322 /NCGR_PEP_ID=MMETSP1086-20130531/34353_1 /TAXON_ID=77921 /ORGANISM="Cyanoptyche  gloeocystis , Strain SAG4.97" /LENGTH=348 /DNA_ID=CAMNT_0041993253 /DNA_START=487 /DNA_END=1533 /DNA_ORIENTATION=-
MQIIADFKPDVVLYTMWYWGTNTNISIPHMFLPLVRSMDALTPRPLNVILSDDAHSHREFYLAAHESLKKLKARYEQRGHAIRQDEIRMYGMVDALITISREDAARVRSLPLTRASPLPISILPYAQKPYVGTSPSAIPAPFHKRSGFTFLGLSLVTTNTISIAEFLRTTWHLLSAQLPDDVTFNIVGEEKATWDRIIDTNTQTSAARRRVRAVGWVEDVHVSLNETRVFLSPIAASTGTNTKNLEAWRHGVPTVTTLYGIQGYNLTLDGKDDAGKQVVLVARDEKDFVDKASALYQDEALWAEVSRNSLEHSRRFGPHMLRSVVADLVQSWQEQVRSRAYIDASRLV